MKAAFWMLLASFAFATMSVCVKFGSAFFKSGELVLFRGVAGLLLMMLWAKFSGVSLKTTRIKMHVVRGCLGVFAISAWFYAIVHLHLATAMTLNYMSSVWLAAIVVGATLLKPLASHKQRRTQWALASAVLLGFVGVVLILKPAFEAGQEIAGIVGLLSGMVAATAYLQVRNLALAGEPEVRIVFYFALGTTLTGLASMAITGPSPWEHWTGHGVLWFIPIGLTASIGQVCMTRAYSSGSTLLAASIQYMGIVFAALYGWILFDDLLTLQTLCGMFLIVLCGIAATVLRSRNTPKN